MTPADGADAPIRRSLQRERFALLEQVRTTLEGPMVVLAAIWLVLIVVEFAAGGLPPTLEVAVWAIWIVFIVDFVVELVIAPDKLGYLRANWLTLLSLVLPAFRVLRVFGTLRALRAVRVVRSVGLLRLATSLNRGLAALRHTARRRGVGYVVAATGLVIVVGAAGMAFFESPASLVGEGHPADAALQDYGDALWWTAYAMTTGATSQPVTPEGRLLGWLLSVYGLAVFGYLTAILASHFVESDRGTRAVSSGAPGPASGSR